jgi:hypothetical protein
MTFRGHLIKGHEKGGPSPATAGLLIGLQPKPKSENWTHYAYSGPEYTGQHVIQMFFLVNECNTTTLSHLGVRLLN